MEVNGIIGSKVDKRVILNPMVGKFNLSEDKVHTEENYIKISNLFEVMNYKYFGRIRRYMVPTDADMNKKKRIKKHKMKLTVGAIEARKQRNDFKKFVQICKKANVPFDTYMEFQFRHFAAEFGKWQNGKKTLSFGYLISPSAAERFEQCATEEEKERDFFGDMKVEKEIELNIKLSIYFSAEKYYNRLKMICLLTLAEDFDEAIVELEFLSKTKAVSNIYVMVSPLADHSEYLSKIRDGTKELITVSQYEEAIEVHKTLEFEDKEIAKYV